MRKDNFEDFKTAIGSSKQITIVTHFSPDGDAMGSSLGLYFFLKALGKNVEVIVPNEYPQFLHWLPGHAGVIVHEKETAKAENYILNSDLIFTLDFNSFKRIEALGKCIEANPCSKVLIDHHQQPDNYAQLVYHDTLACSTSELIYEFICGVANADSVDKNIATCLYTGIMTDSGSFRFNSVTANTHKITAELIAKGANNSDIYSAVNDNFTKERLRLLGHCLAKMVVLDEFKAAYIFLTTEELEKFSFQKGDTEGIVNYALSIGNVVCSAFFNQAEDGVKISFRSKGKFDVNAFARAHFAGGGHINAAGAKSHLSMEETVKKFVDLLPSYKAQIDAAI